MLPPETQDRIYDVIPDTQTVTYRLPTDSGSTTVQADVPITVREQNADTPPRGAYPIAAVSFAPTTVNWTPGQRLPDTHHKVAVPGDDTIAYEEYVGEDVYDVLNIVIAVADGIDVDGDGAVEIPKKVVAKELAREVYAAYLLGTEHLNDPATTSDQDYVWPVKVEETTGQGITEVPATGEMPTVKYAMQFNCRYTFTEKRVVEATERIDYTIDIDDADDNDVGSSSGSINL